MRSGLFPATVGVCESGEELGALDGDSRLTVDPARYRKQHELLDQPAVERNEHNDVPARRPEPNDYRGLP